MIAGKKRTLPNDDYSTFATADTLLILTTASTDYEISSSLLELLAKEYSDHAFQTILFYAECIQLKDSIRLAGKNIGIFCTRLSLPEGDERICLDVSGEPGEDISDAVVTPGLQVRNGNTGGDGGSIWLYVQELPVSGTLLDRLRIKSVGGAGGKGQTTTVASGIGGKGGDGGNPGSLMFMFGTDIYIAGTELGDVLDVLHLLPWQKQITTLKKILSPILDRIAGESARTFTVFNVLSELYFLIRKLLLPVGSKWDGKQEALNDLESKVKDVVDDIRLCLKRDKVEQKSKEIFEGFEKSLGRVLEDWTTKAPHEILENVVAAFKTLEHIPPPLIKALTRRVSTLMERTELDALGTCEIAPGVGGRGGDGGGGVGNPGKGGENGNASAGNLLCRHFQFNGAEDDLATLHAFAIPEQCQMLLNKANSHFFSNKNEELVTASELYSRLIKRLSFVNALQVPSNSDSALSQSYADLEFTKKITFSPIQKLSGILAEASGNLNKIMTGQDMFGHSPLWVPRISVAFYREGVAAMSKRLEKMEELVSSYEDLYKSGVETLDTVKNVAKIAKEDVQQYQDRRDALTSENGPLQTCAYKIASRSRKLVELKKGLKEKLEAAAPYIQQAFQMDFNWAIEIISTLVAIPEGGPIAGIISVTNIGYKIHTTATEISNASGESFKKEFVVNKLKTCGTTFESLKDVITTEDDHMLSLSDPGADKVLASREDIRKLLDDFESVIPEQIRNNITTPLDQYVDYVIERNDAVLEYNTLLSQISETVDQEAAARNQLAVLLDSKRVHEIDPNMPAIAFWLRNARDELRLELLRRFNYESRAIQYWGLQPSEEIAFRKPGPIRGFTEIAQAQTKLENAFETALEAYAGSTWSTFPKNSNYHGKIYKLSPEEVAQLATPITDANHERVYILHLTLTPSHEGLENTANFRINQIRFWIFGAAVSPLGDDTGRQMLTINLQHSGEETILDSKGRHFNFWHSPVNLQFIYNAKGITGIEKTLDAKKKKILFGTQQIEKDYRGGGSGEITKTTMASIGPFTTWRILLREKENKGLDLSKVTGASMEFYGGSSPVEYDSAALVPK